MMMVSYYCATLDTILYFEKLIHPPFVPFKQSVIGFYFRLVKLDGDYYSKLKALPHKYYVLNISLLDMALKDFI
jgi:hypothetical protein